MCLSAILGRWLDAVVETQLVSLFVFVIGGSGVFTAMLLWSPSALPFPRYVVHVANGVPAVIAAAIVVGNLRRPGGKALIWALVIAGLYATGLIVGAVAF